MSDRSAAPVGVAAILLGLAAVVLSTRSPAFGLALVVTAWFGTWAILRPYRAACVLAFLTAAFPKAGVKVADFPFPIFLFGLIVAAVLLRTVFKAHRQPPMTVVVLLITATWLTYRISVAAQFGPAAVAAFIAWSIMPVALLVLVSSLEGVPGSFRRSIELGFLVSVAYALLQFVTSVETVSVPGLTSAFGDDLSRKNNVIYSATGDDFSKIPSTYQNGNIYGLVAAVMLVCAMRRILERRATRLDVAVLLGSALAIAVSGSRMAIVTAALTVFVLYLGHGSLSRKLGAAFALTTVAAGVLLIQPGLVQRYSLQNLAETGGAGRSAKWSGAIDRFTFVNWLTGTADQNPVEGWPGVVMQLGVVGIVLLGVSYWVLSARRREWWPVALVLITGAFFDSAYLLFPTWFLPAALLAVPEKGLAGRSDPKPLRRRVADGRDAVHVGPADDSLSPHLRVTRSGPTTPGS